MYLYIKSSCYVNFIIKNNVKVSKSRTCAVNKYTFKEKATIIQ